MNLDRVKNFVAKNKPVLAIAIVATATIVGIAIDVALRENEPFQFDALKESE